MTPLEYLRSYDDGSRLPSGEYYSAGPLDVEEGDRVGVVLFNLGGPQSLDDVEPFLYNLLMDPAFLDLPVGGRVRHWLAKGIARFRADTLRQNYELIGGGSPLPRLTAEQAESLQSHLNEWYGDAAGIDFRTYPSMRYWHPFSGDTAQKMAADGVDKVVLLPLYPQYSKTTTGSSLAYWHALDAADAIPSWPTTYVQEYAANPKYVQALSERIDEALQRFPEPVRDDVELVFSAHAAPLQKMGTRRDPYCCLVHSTVDRVMALRDENRPFHTAYQSIIGPNYQLDPALVETVKTLADQGRRSVLVIPISFVTDHVNTSYELDIEVREEVEAYGIDYFEVTAGLNTHPLFLEALGEATVAQLDLPVDARALHYGGDGVSRSYPLRPLTELPRLAADERRVQCQNCDENVGARRWMSPAPSADEFVSPDRPRLGEQQSAESH